MNYKKINASIFDGKDYLDEHEKTNDFYQYLLENNVAFYYSKCISKSGNKSERMILKKGEDEYKKYKKTLTLLHNISKKYNLEFLLFKTYKDISGTTGGDIDIFVKGNEFKVWISLLKKEGFECDLEKKYSHARCEKKNYLKIEPRTEVRIHGNLFVRENAIWKYHERIKIGQCSFLKTTKELDLLFQVLNVLYGPSYIKLYRYKYLREVSIRRLSSYVDNKNVLDDFFMIKDMLVSEKKLLDQRFPLFLKNASFLNLWRTMILPNKNFSNKDKIRHVLFFFYIKYKLLLLQKLYPTKR